MGKDLLFRKCVNCQTTIEFKPRRIKCLDCYLNEIKIKEKRKIEFINDD